MPRFTASARTADFPVRRRQRGTASPPAPPTSSLTFRNVHNWMMGDKPYADAFKQMYAMLKPGGMLGVEEHRLPESADIAREKKSGYVKISTVRRLAEAAGFRFVGSSEINANPSGHQGLSRGRVDAAADPDAEGQGSRQICRDRRERPDDAQVRQAALIGPSAMAIVESLPAHPADRVAVRVGAARHRLWPAGGRRPWPPPPRFAAAGRRPATARSGSAPGSVANGHSYASWVAHLASLHLGAAHVSVVEPAALAAAVRPG